MRLLKAVRSFGRRACRPNGLLKKDSVESSSSCCPKISPGSPVINVEVATNDDMSRIGGLPEVRLWKIPTFRSTMESELCAALLRQQVPDADIPQPQTTPYQDTEHYGKHHIEPSTADPNLARNGSSHVSGEQNCAENRCAGENI